MKAITCIIICLLVAVVDAKDLQEKLGWRTNASWYGEKHRGLPTANHREDWVFNPDDWCCASWDYNFSDVLLITNAENGLRVLAIVVDKGPSLRLYYEDDVRLDLSESAYNHIKGDSLEGRLSVYVELVPEVKTITTERIK